MTSGTLLPNGQRVATVAWLGLVIGSTVAIVALHRLGADPSFQVDWLRIWDWLDQVTPERALLALIRSTALALAYWIAASTLLCTAARASRIPALVRSVEWFTLPVVRRAAERVVAVTLSVSTLTSSGAAIAMAADSPLGDALPGRTEVSLEASAPDTRYVPIPAGDGNTRQVGDPDPEEPRGYVPAPAGDPNGAGHVTPPPVFVPSTLPEVPAGPPEDAVPVDHAAEVAPAPPTTDTTYTIRPGDHLWAIAERHVAEALGRTPTDAEIATYWAHLIDLNLPRLRSGNPDLIFPGESIECPPVGDVGLS